MLFRSRSGEPAEPINVVAYGKLNAHGADVVASGILDFGPDAQGRAKLGHFDVSFERGRKAEYELIGDKGFIRCHNMWSYPTDDPVISWEAGGKSETIILPKANHFNLEIEHFSDCVLNGKSPLLTFADAKGNCRAIEMVISALTQ